MTSTLRTFPWVLFRSLRLIPWWYLGLGLAAAFALATTRRNPYPDDLVFGLRVGAVALATSTAFVFDDPAGNIMDGKPVPLSLQRAARLFVALPVVAASWWLLVTWMEAGLGPQNERAIAALPKWALTLELVTLVGVVWAVATLVMLTGRDAGGTVAALSLLTVVVLLVLLPERWSVFPSLAVAPEPGWEAWVDGHRRWAGIAVIAWAAVALGVVGSTRRQPTVARLPIPGRTR
ncbi:MAG: hypothetical protein R2823_00090 [Acidimicrobiia bacterium]